MQKTSRKKGLLRRFWPYLKKYRRVLVFDLFCAALTTICDMVLPLIMRYLTNTAMTNLAALTAGAVLRLGGFTWCCGLSTARPTTTWRTWAM